MCVRWRGCDTAHATRVTRPLGHARAHLVTLCRFDDKPEVGSYSGPFIPCERRLDNMEISGIQGRDFRLGFFEIGSMPGLMHAFR